MTKSNYEKIEQSHEESFESLTNNPENCCKPLITKYWDNRLKRYEYTTHENGEVKFLTYEDGYKRGQEDAFNAIFGHQNWYKQEYEEAGKPDDDCKSVGEMILAGFREGAKHLYKEEQEKC